MEHWNPVQTPIPQVGLGSNQEEESFVNLKWNHPYVVGMILYLPNKTPGWISLLLSSKTLDLPVNPRRVILRRFRWSCATWKERLTKSSLSNRKEPIILIARLMVILLDCMVENLERIPTLPGLSMSTYNLWRIPCLLEVTNYPWNYFVYFVSWEMLVWLIHSDSTPSLWFNYWVIQFPTTNFRNTSYHLFYYFWIQHQGEIY